MVSKVFVPGTIIDSAWLNDVNDSVYKILTVATLPDAVMYAGQKRMVSDANSTTFYSVVVGGGSITIPVFSDGINWRIG